ncbi:MAG: patatin-like phospholipase family protein [Saprospiraceae bacterium]
MLFKKRSLQEKLDATTGTKRILSLDGGGVRGILTLGFLEKIEKILQERYEDKDLRLSDYYDLIGGTSTGAIIAAGLSIGLKVSEIIKLYEELGEVVFGKLNYSLIPRDWTSFRAIFKSTYSSENLEKQLQNTFGSIEIGDAQKLKCGLAIHSKRADTYSLWTVTNHPAGMYFGANKSLKLWELCRASSAAPYYFKPKLLKLKKRNGESFDAAFIDGGVSLANNPAFQMFLASTVPTFGFQWNTGENNLLITSLGTGNGIAKDDPNALIEARSVSWASKLSNLFMIDALEMNQIILQSFGKNHGPTDFIDSQFGDLKDINYLKEKLFSFTRHNVKLIKSELTKLDLHFSDEKIKSITEMDHYENIPDLLEIGRKASVHFTENNLPSTFDQ